MPKDRVAINKAQMEKTMNNQNESIDDIYYVSAAEIADKIMDRMRRGLDPLLLSNSSLTLISLGPTLRTHSLTRFD
jgi:hypothetical protein